MHAKLESLLLARAGFLNKDKDSRLNNYILYARPTDNPNTFDLVAMASGKNIATVQVTKEELDSMGYSLYERERNVRSKIMNPRSFLCLFLLQPIDLTRNGRRLIRLVLSLLSRMRRRRLLGWLISMIFKVMI